ncbi:hypothetical protein KSS87_011991 [Heliosperma pusillum]|nr:hypothetical protein KSS87_011991 [Heliosperma pusillum]
MEKLCLSSTQFSTVSHPFLPLFSSFRIATRKRVHYPITNPKKFSIFASKDDTNNNNNLNEWDLMELKFGKMLGEDPKLTLAKVMGRKLNPDASYIDIEKNFNRNKGKLVEVREVPFDVPEKLGDKKVANGLNLVKPVPKKGIVVGGVGNDSPLPEIKRPSGSIKTKSASSKSNVPNVILRKPSVFNDEDDADSESRMRIKRNLTLSMSTEPVKEKFSGMTLLKKPQPSLKEEESDGGNENDVVNGLTYDGLTNGLENDIEDDWENNEQNPTSSSSEVPLLEKPTAFLSQYTEEDALSSMLTGTESVGENHIEAFTGAEGYLVSKDRQLGEGSQTRMQHHEQTDAGYTEKETETGNPSTVKATASESFMGSVLQGRPKRLDQPRQAMPYPNHEGTVSARPLKDSEEIDWTRVEQLFNIGARVDIELISCSPRGFVASFGSLVGFLPYRNLVAKWKFLAFESWLRKNDLDPSKYRQSLSVIGNDEGQHMSMSLEYPASSAASLKTELKVTADMELEDLLRIYDLEKIQYLSSYVGQRIKVNILYADKKSRKLIFSMRPKEKEETVEKKRNLMKKLSVGDVVKCCIKKITYFGIFVDVEGVPALVHQSEVSWDYTLNPALYLKIGEIVEAKVHQLDFALDRIFLSLKEITPDPLNEALECIVGNNNFNGGLETAEADSEWPEVDSLIKEIQGVAGVQAVSKGRFFLSPGLAPTFQVYMASMFENQYKLLARSGNKVQEVVVEASLDKEDMKTAILKCTNRVEL